MDDQPRSTTWWQTLPGILTAVAALLTAVGGLILAFHQAGLFDRSSQKSDPLRSETVKSSAMTADPSKTSGSTKISPTDPTAPNSLTLPADTEVRAGDLVYKILGARLDRYAPGKVSLKFDVRMTNNGRFPANFWGDSFRLRVDGVPRAPDNSLNELVAANSAKEGAVEFVIPDTTTDVGLQVGEVGESAPAIPIALKDAKP